MPNARSECEVELLHVERRRLEDHLELVVLVDAHRVLAEAAVAGPPRGLAVGDAPRLGTEHAEEGVRVHRPRADLEVVRLLQDAALLGPVAPGSPSSSCWKFKARPSVRRARAARCR